MDASVKVSKCYCCDYSDPPCGALAEFRFECGALVNVISMHLRRGDWELFVVKVASLDASGWFDDYNLEDLWIKYDSDTKFLEFRSDSRKVGKEYKHKLSISLKDKNVRDKVIAALLASCIEIPWKDQVFRQLARADATDQFKEYVSFYNMLLYTEFPATEGFVVAPNVLPVSDSDVNDNDSAMNNDNAKNSAVDNDDLYSTVEFVVEASVKEIMKPVFLLHVHPRRCWESKTFRSIADQQLRRRLTDLTTDCIVNPLHAINAFGDECVSYITHTLTKTITPPALNYGPNSVNVFPEPLWRDVSSTLPWLPSVLEINEVFAAVKDSVKKLE